MKPSGRSGPPRCNSAAQEAAGKHSPDSPNSRSSSPTSPPPRNGASANSTPSATCSTATPGYHPASNQPDKPAPPGPATSRRRHLVNSYADFLWPPVDAWISTAFAEIANEVPVESNCWGHGRPSSSAGNARGRDGLTVCIAVDDVRRAPGVAAALVGPIMARRMTGFTSTGAVLALLFPT